MVTYLRNDTGQSTEKSEALVLVDMRKIDELRQLSEEVSAPKNAMSMLDELFIAYRAQAQESVALLTQFVEQGDYASIVPEAHKLRGLCLNLGLNAMSSLTEMIEQHKPEMQAGLKDLVKQLQASHIETNEILAGVLQNAGRKKEK